MPAAASRVYFKFYECESCDEKTKHQVKIVYAPSSKDFSLELPLIFSSHQSPDGLMPTWALEKWIKEKLEQVSKEMGSDSTDFDKICAIKYEQRHAHQDPEAWR